VAELDVANDDADGGGSAAPPTSAVAGTSGAPLASPTVRLAWAADAPRAVIAAWRWRHDLPGWRWRRIDGPDPEPGFAAVGYDDAGWDTVPHLHPIYDRFYAGGAQFRQSFLLPAELEGERLVVGLGGMDDEDWLLYRAFLNGVEIDRWSASGRWREPRRIHLGPDEAAYGAARFGDVNVLAVETIGLDRPLPDHADPDESEHFFFQGWLVDQFVAAGSVVEETVDWGGLARDNDGWLNHPAGLSSRVVDTESVGGATRTVTVRNDRSESVLLLDLELASVDVDAEGAWTKGGRGTPAVGDSWFVASSHPAVLVRGVQAGVNVLALVGRRLEPGEAMTFPATTIAVSVDGAQDGAALFRAHLATLRPRRARRLTIYSALGWTDYASGAAERPNLNASLFEENLALLEELRSRGVAFDLYEFDDWWDPDDFMRFDRERFPEGSAPLARRVHDAGMRPALWSATTQAAWSSHGSPGLEPSIAGGVARELGWQAPPEEVSSWDWDAVFSYVATGQMRYCWASEPFRGRIRDSLLHHLVETGAGAVKLDCTVLHCTSSDHDHFAGKYSVHAIHDAVIGVVETLRAAEPELFVVWYWGFQSPLWLQHGDVMFDKSLKLEAASPASRPARSWRAAVGVTADQAIAHAPLIPLALQDSLGVWIGNVPWANFMGRDDWRSAFLLDLARGSTLLSLWGDLTLFDDDDVRFLAAALELARLTRETFDGTRRVGGDPWRFEPYGYVQPTSDGRHVVTLVNPSFEPQMIRLAPEQLGGGRGVAEVVYPWRHSLPVGSDGLLAHLWPWEIRCLLVGGESVSESPQLPCPPETVDLSASIAIDRTRTGDRHPVKIRLDGQVPRDAGDDVLVVWLGLQRDGAWRYDPEPQGYFEARAVLGGKEIALDVVPGVRSWNGPGCPWVTYSCSLAGESVGTELSVAIEGRLPQDYEVLAGAFVWASPNELREGELVLPEAARV
jgi:hypothetical protein